MTVRWLAIALGLVLGMAFAGQVADAPAALAHTVTVPTPTIDSLTSDGDLTVTFADSGGYHDIQWYWRLCRTEVYSLQTCSTSFVFNTASRGDTATIDIKTEDDRDFALLSTPQNLFVIVEAKYDHHSATTVFTSWFAYEPSSPTITSVSGAGVMTFNIALNAAEETTFWICTEASSTQDSSVCGSETVTTDFAVGTGHTKDLSAVTLPGGGTFDGATHYWFYLRAERSGATLTHARAYYPWHRPCSAVLSPAVDFGTLGTAEGVTLPSVGTYDGYIENDPLLAPCSDENSRPSQYFSFTLAEGGGIRFRAESDPDVTGYLKPEIRILPTIGGTPTFANAINEEHESVIGVILDAGTHIAQVRSARSEYSATLQGDYAFTVRRIYPETSSLTFSSNSLSVTYDLGAYTPNMEASIEYKRNSDTTWTTIDAAARNDAVNGVKKRLVNETVQNLGVNTQYDLRARFKYAGDSQYTTNSGVTLVPVAFPAPTRPSLDDPTYNEPGTPFSVLVMANWHYPQVKMTDGGDGSDWGWVVEWGGESATSGSKSLRSATTFYERDIGRTVRVRVQGVFQCQDDEDSTDEPCQVYIAGYHNLSNVNDRYEIPEGETWYTAWSENNVFTVQADHLEVPTGIEPETDPLPGIVEAIDSVLAAIGVAPESRRPDVWAFFLCFSLAIGGGFGGFAITGGTKRFFWAATFGGFVFFLVFVMAGPAWFGIDPVFAYATLVVPLMMVAFSAIGSVRT